MYIKLTLKHILLIVLLTGLVQGSCISYGHSCWGAHGKRASIPLGSRQNKGISERWALLKIIPDKTDRYGEKLSPDITAESRSSILENIKRPETSYIQTSDEDFNINTKINNKNHLKKKSYQKQYTRFLDSSNPDDETNDFNNNIDDSMDTRNVQFLRLLNNELEG